MNENNESLKARKIRVSIYLTPITDEIGTGKTGAWRNMRPVWNTELCKPCDACIKFCPDGVISMKDKKIYIDYIYCKGCGICSHECPRNAIEMIEEPKED